MTAIPTHANDTAGQRPPRLSRPEDQPRLTAAEAAAEGRYITADEFEELTEREGWELIDGKLVEQAMSFESAFIGGEIFRRMSNHVVQERLGVVVPQDTAFRCFGPDADRVRKPDAAFIRQSRVPARPWWQDAQVVPDLTVEVISTHDEVEKVATKAHQLFDAGVEVTWFLMPQSRLGLVLHRDGAGRWLRETDAFDGGDLLPGFTLPLAEILPPPEAEAAAHP